MGLFATKTRELKRTCDRCGHVWYITPQEKRMRPPNKMQLAGQRMQIAGNKGKLIGGKKKAIAGELKLQRMLDKQARVEEIGRCGSCGSVSFTEEPA